MCPNQSEETCIIFNQSGVELRLLAPNSPCISHVFLRLENGAGHVLEFCDVTIICVYANVTFFSLTIVIKKLFYHIGMLCRVAL